MNRALPPGPRYPSFLQGVGHWARPTAYLEKLRARYGKRFTTRFVGLPPFVIITEPDQVKEVYTAPPDVLQPGRGAKVLEPLVGRNSVLLLDGDEHMTQRKLMLPAFHGEKMAALTELVEEVTRSEVETWEGRERLAPLTASLTLEVILRAVFGLDPGPRLDALRDALTRLLAFANSPLTLIPVPDDPEKAERSMKRFNRIGPLKGFYDARLGIDALIAEQVAERRAQGDTGRDDVLAMLLEARHEDGSEMSGTELRDELMTMLAAGHETTASSLAWAFERLTREPEVLARLTEEVRGGDEDEYLTATIREILRRRPVLPNTLPRYVEKPITVGGWDYPTGCCLVANAYLLHHDADVYPDPYSFRPERWLGETPGTYSWIPFGGGRRRCLGANFALLEMKVVIREVLRSYDLAPSTEPEFPRRRNITITPKRGASVGLTRRTREPVAA